MEEKEAVKELERCAGTQFDPRAVEEFISFLKNKNNSKHPQN
ncbi:MAG: hypothetical protein ACQEP5_07255 [Actinomycetota bacterium]